MNSIVAANIIRTLILVFAQVLIFKRIAFNFGDFAFIHFLIYPLVIILLPINIPRPIMMLIGFFTGMFVDIFYDSPGIHSSACVFTAYIRTYVLSLIEPYEGYNVNLSPTIKNMGLGWFLTYSSTLLGLHLFFYFSVEAFSFVFLFEIILNTIFSLIASLSIIMLILLIFNPKY